jgi:hypothetical protein
MRFYAKLEKLQAKQKELVMLRLASPCDAVQNTEKWTQNPPRATSWGFDPPSRHQLSYLFSVVLRRASLTFSDTSGTK